MCNRLRLIVPVFVCLTVAAQQANRPNSQAANGVAELNGVVITREEFESKNSTRLFQAKNTYFEAQKKALADYIDERLLEEQAQREKITVAELYERHVKAALPPDPSDEALRIYFEGLDTKEPFEVMREKIREHIRQRRLERLKAAYLESLRKDAKIVAYLQAPRMEVPLQNYPVRGAQKAPVLIVEYADYECPYCQQIEPVLQRVRSSYAGKIAFVYKDVPLPNHPNAQKAAEAKLCAGVQGKYWEYHDMLVDSRQLQLPALKEFARNLKLNGEEFERCLDSGAQAGVIRAVITEAQNLGVQGTPSFLINGRFFSGVLTYEALSQVVEEELRSSSATENVAKR